MALLASLILGAAGIKVDQGQNLSHPVNGYQECGRPGGWCHGHGASYLFEDCNGDGIKDRVCYNKNKKWIRMSGMGNCNVLNNGQTTNPTCHDLRKKAAESQMYIYATGTDNKVYRQRLEGLSANGNWESAGKGSVKALIHYKDTMIGIGTNNKVFVQSLSLMSKHTHWQEAARGDVVDGDTHGDTLYAVGTNGRVYSQHLGRMSTSSHWTESVSRGHVISIAIHEPSNWLYAVNSNGHLFRIALNQLRAGNWALVKQNGLCYHISIRGDDIYCRGRNKQLYRQKITTLRHNSHWHKVAKGSVMSVMVPKIPMCVGSLLSKQADDFACDSIKDATTCSQRYERAGKTNTYLQCSASAVAEGSTIVNCLASTVCEP